MPHPFLFKNVSMSDPPNPERQSLALVRPTPIRPRQGMPVVRRTQSPVDRPSIVPSKRPSPNTSGPEFSPAARIPAPETQVFSLIDGRSSLRASQPSSPNLMQGKSADTFPPEQSQSASCIAEMLSSTRRHLPAEYKVELMGKELVAVHQSIHCGDEECIEYPVSTLPFSMLPADDEELFKELPATKPSLRSLTIEVPSIPCVFDVEPFHTDVVTVWDVLEAIYQKRDQFGNRWFQGLSGLSWTRQKLRLQLHLTNTN